MTNVQKFLKTFGYDKTGQKKIIKRFVDWYVKEADECDLKEGCVNWLEDDNADGFELAVLTDVSYCFSPLTKWADNYAKKACAEELKKRN